MTKKRKKTLNLGIVIGILGFVSGVILLFSQNYLIGGSGAVASAALVYKGIVDLRTANKEVE